MVGLTFGFSFCVYGVDVFWMFGWSVVSVWGFCVEGVVGLI